MMAYPKLLTLAKSLHRNTMEGKIDWEDSAKKGVYQAIFGNNTIQISAHPSEFPGELDIAIKILDDSGNEVESFMDTDIGKMLDEGPTRKSFYDSMAETYQTAKRIALGTEKVIDTILNILDHDQPF